MRLVLYSKEKYFNNLDDELHDLGPQFIKKIRDLEKVVLDDSSNILIFAHYENGEDKLDLLFKKYSVKKHVFFIVVSETLDLKALKKHQKGNSAASGYIKGPVTSQFIREVVSDFSEGMAHFGIGDSTEIRKSDSVDFEDLSFASFDKSAFDKVKDLPLQQTNVSETELFKDEESHIESQINTKNDGFENSVVPDLEISQTNLELDHQTSETNESNFGNKGVTVERMINEETGEITIDDLDLTGGHDDQTSDFNTGGSIEISKTNIDENNVIEFGNGGEMGKKSEDSAIDLTLGDNQIGDIEFSGPQGDVTDTGVNIDNEGSIDFDLSSESAISSDSMDDIIVRNEKRKTHKEQTQIGSKGEKIGEGPTALERVEGGSIEQVILDSYNHESTTVGDSSGDDEDKTIVANVDRGTDHTTVGGTQSSYTEEDKTILASLVDNTEPGGNLGAFPFEIRDEDTNNEIQAQNKLSKSKSFDIDDDTGSRTIIGGGRENINISESLEFQKASNKGYSPDNASNLSKLNMQNISMEMILPTLKDLNLDPSELERASSTISQLRSDREKLLREVKNERTKTKEVESENITLKAQLEELRLELDIIKRRSIEQIHQAQTDLKVNESKKVIYERKLKDYQLEFEKLNQKVRVDLNSVKQREKHLENQLELMVVDTESRLKSRDAKILELKRKIDALEFTMENLSIKEKKSREEKAKLESRLGKIMNSLKGSIQVLEDDIDLDDEIEKQMNR
ncbi:MAG: hypothetical protein H6622_05780 [Halobacteriovoraceae bacterium]|nr:hypothetical protein [Halobacteriovoraceae bacterium]